KCVLSGAGQFEIEVGCDCKSRTFVDIVGLGINGDLSRPTSGVKDLPFPFLCSSAGDGARVQCAVADGRDIDEDRTFFAGMDRVRTFEPGQNIAENQLVVHRTGLGISPIIDEQIDIGVYSRVNWCRVQCIFPTCGLSLVCTWCSLCITQCSSEPNCNE